MPLNGSMCRLWLSSFYARRQSIIDTLEQGTHVVCDRYAFSGIAYSCVKGLSYDWCRSPDVGLPSPDLTLFLSLTPEVAAQRGGYGQERYEALAIQTKVRQIFETLGKDGSVGRWRIIDAGRTADQVAEDCIREAQETVKHVTQSAAPVGTLFV